MNPLEKIFTLSWQQGWELLGWTMCYFLAAGAAVALAGALLRFLSRHSAPQIRYATSLVVFSLMAALPFGIAIGLSQHMPAKPQAIEPVVIDLANTPMRSPSLREPIELTSVTIVETPTVETPRFADVVLARQDGGAMKVVEFLPWVWLLGTPLTFLLLATGLVGSERLRQRSTLLTDGPIFEACQRLRGSLRISRRVGIAVCERIASPLLVGVVRPLILLPPAALTGWSPDELEMVLLHELAHVRRWDNLVNLVQRIVESLLFFHPCVWWVSHWVRRDREECCDAVVVARTARPRAYAELLVALATPSSPLAGLTMAQHPLAGRIRRILHLEDEKMLVSRGAFGWLGLLIVAFLAVALSQPTTETVAQESKLKTVNGQTEVAEVVRESESAEKTSSPFLSLEDQRAADLAYKLLGLELEPLSEKELARVKPLGHEGGLRVVQTVGIATSQNVPRNACYPEDLLVGLHVWPVKSLQDVAKILQRNDIAELSPLKFYSLRSVGGGGLGGGGLGGGFGNVGGGPDKIVSGRVKVNTTVLNNKSPGNTSPAATSAILPANLEKLSPGDRVKLLVVGEFPDQPIDNEYTIESMGTLALGPTYGRVKVAGMTLLEAEASVKKQLEKMLTEVEVQITLVYRANSKQQSTPEKSLQSTTLLYDNKTFEQWRSQWKNELKTEKRTEAIRAMAAFGRAGYGKEAAEAILDVAGEYDFLIIEGSPEGKLKEKVLDVLTNNYGKPLEVNLWLPNLLKHYQEDQKKWKSFASHAISRLYATSGSSLHKQLFKLARSDDEVIRGSVIMALAKSKMEDAEVRQLAEDWMDSGDEQKALLALGLVRRTHFAHFGGGGYLSREPAISNSPIRSLSALLAALVHPSQEVRYRSRYKIPTLSEGDAERIVAALIEKLEGAKDPQKTIAIVRALAAIGEQATSANERLLQLFEQSEAESVKISALVALELIGTLEKFKHEQLVEKLAGFNAGDLDKTTAEAEANQLRKRQSELQKTRQKEANQIFRNHPRKLLGSGTF